MKIELDLPQETSAKIKTMAIRFNCTESQIVQAYCDMHSFGPEWHGLQQCIDARKGTRRHNMSGFTSIGLVIDEMNKDAPNG